MSASAPPPGGEPNAARSSAASATERRPRPAATPDGTAMHRHTDQMTTLAESIAAHVKWRTELDPIPVDGPATAEELARSIGPTITSAGIGPDAALAAFTEHLGPACMSADSPRYLAFVPAAPTEASILFDLVVSAHSMYGGSWLEGAGAAHAENEALDWLRRLAGLPAGAGGVFVPGGTLGNLAAIAAALHAARTGSNGRAAGTDGGHAADSIGPADPPQGSRWKLVVADSAHSSVIDIAEMLGLELVVGPTDPSGRLLGGPALDQLLDAHPSVVAVVATAGTTNAGLIDDLTGIGQVARAHGVWFHVDAAYGGAGLCAPSIRHHFDGIELADSYIVDPHKWLFAPYDCCALIYRDPDRGRAAHSQHADYLAFLDAHGDWNPSDFGVHLTRRARGLPFWFSLAVHGTDAYAAAVEATLDITAEAADQIRAAPHLELVTEPGLSILLLRRVGWTTAQYEAATTAMLESQTGFVVPTRHMGETVFRFCFVNPRTTPSDVAAIIDFLAR